MELIVCSQSLTFDWDSAAGQVGEGAKVRAQQKKAA
jgi:hypothetical protein